MRLGVGDAFVGQPGVQLVVGFDPKPRREETFAHQTDLVLDLPLLPARSRRAGHRINQMVAAHLQEAPIILTVLADEDRLHRRLHVVVDAARAGAFEEREGALVRVEHHLLRLARIGPARTSSGCGTDACARPSRSPSRRSAERSRGSSRTGRLRPARTTAARRQPTDVGSRVRAASSAHSDEPRRSRPHSPARATLRTAGSASDARALLARVRRQKPIQRLLPAADPWQRLLTTFVAKLGRLRSQHLPDRLSRNPQLAADRLDRLPLNKICPADLRDRLHDQHPDQGPRAQREPS